MTTAQPLPNPLGLPHVQARLQNLPQTMTTDFVRIDKAVAQELLGCNTHNRPLNGPKVQQHIETMDRGRWTQTGDPIRISKTGVLLDGQTKLTAIYKSGHTYDYLVVWGLDDEAQDYMDTGSKRALSHALKLKGEANPNALGGAVRMVWQIEQGGTPSKWLLEPTYAEYYEFILQHPDIRDSVAVGLQVGKTLKAPASPIAAAHYFCALHDKQDADDFFTLLADPGAQLQTDSPILALRGTVLKWAARGSVSRMEQASLYDVCVRAYDKYSDGHTATGFRLNRRPRTYIRPS